MLASGVLVAALALQLSFVPPVARTTVWVIDLDTTTSQTGDQFSTLVESCRDTILPLVRPGDTIVLLMMEHAPGQPTAEPQVLVLPRTRQFVTKIVAFDAELRRQTQTARHNNHLTDIGGLFEWTRENIEIARQARAIRSDRSSQMSYVLFGATDGKMEGVQSGQDRMQPSLHGVDYHVVMLGGNSGTEAGLRALAKRAGFDDTKRMLVVPRTQMGNQSAIQTFLGRFPNPDVVQKLKAAVMTSGSTATAENSTAKQTIVTTSPAKVAVAAKER